MSRVTIDASCVLVREASWPSLRNERFMLLLRHWAGQRRGAPMPAKAALDPVEFASCLDSLSLFRLDREGGQFVCTLSGETDAEAWGQSLVGKRHADFLDSASASILVRRCHVMMETPALSHASSPLGRTGGAGLYKVAHRLSLPLADKDGLPWGLISVTEFGKAVPQPQEGVDPIPAQAILYDCRVLPQTLP